MNRIVITGASGFVGKNLVAFLEKNNYLLSQLSLRNRLSGFKASDASSVAIIHLAGKAHDLKKTSLADEYFKVNTDLTVELFNAFLDSDIKDFIFFSSVKASADVVHEVLDETSAPKPITAYGMSKLKAEEYLLAQPLPKGKRLFILRPCMIHGPGNKGNLNLLYQLVSKGIPYPLGAFNNERSFLSIDNLNYVISKLLSDQTINSGVYNLADDEFVSTNDLIKIIGVSEGKNARIWNIPSGVVKLIARIGDIVKLPLNSERLQKLTENYKVSNIKIKQALHIEKLPLTAQDGLLKTLQSFKK